MTDVLRVESSQISSAAPTAAASINATQTGQAELVCRASALGGESVSPSPFPSGRGIRCIATELSCQRLR